MHIKGTEKFCSTNNLLNILLFKKSAVFGERITINKEYTWKRLVFWFSGKKGLEKYLERVARLSKGST